MNADQIECTIPLDAPGGSDSFEVKLWDGTDGSGNLLGVGDTIADVTGIPSDAITVTVKGIVATMRLTLPNPSPQSCEASPQTLPITVQAYDPDDNLITGAADYYNPITLALASNQYGALRLSNASVTSPGSVVTLSYNNGPVENPITVNGSADGATSSSVSADPENYWPLNATYTYDDTSGGSSSSAAPIMETIRATTSLPTNYFNTGASFPNLPVDFSTIPRPVCDVKETTTYQSGPYQETDTVDSYVGLSTNYGKTSVVVYLEYWNGTRTDGALYEDETYYPTPYIIDLLPEAKGDSWSDDPSFVDIENGADYSPLGGEYDFETSLTATNECYGWPNAQYSWSDCWYQTTSPDAFANLGPKSIPSTCHVGSGIPTTADEVSTYPYYSSSASSSTKYTSYNADGIGPVCVSEYSTGLVGDMDGSTLCWPWCALQSVGSASSGSFSRVRADSLRAQRGLKPSTLMRIDPGMGLRAQAHSHAVRRLICRSMRSKINHDKHLPGSILRKLQGDFTRACARSIKRT